MLEPEAGNLFACRWAPGDDREQESFRIVEVAAISGDGLMVWAYGNSFAEPPSSVSVTALRRIRLHKSLGGPVAVPKGEFRSWHPAVVARA